MSKIVKKSMKRAKDNASEHHHGNDADDENDDLERDPNVAVKEVKRGIRI
jgi:hypothetical protein